MALIGISHRPFKPDSSVTVEHLGPAAAFALVGCLGIGAQWFAWRFRMPAIVLMLAAGLLVGPGLGLLDPARDIGPLVSDAVSVAVAVILFEGGLTLNLRELADAATGVRRLVVIGAPLGWLLSALALHYGAGLGWEASAVFGGILIVTGPTVIAPLLRQAKLARRPANLLQWEAIVNDPLGALAAVLAFGLVSILHKGASLTYGAGHALFGILAAALIGWLAGRGIALAFRRGAVPDYLKVPVLFATLVFVFALPDSILHESGLLAVTVMGMVIANAGLASFQELRRFKENVTTLLVSGVFILLASGIKPEAIQALDVRAVFFVLLIVLVARPLAVLASFLGTDIPRNERLLVAFTGPRGVVLMAVAGLFGARLLEAGIQDGARVGPLAFLLVVSTVVIHGFTLGPLARALGLSLGDAGGVLIVGASRFTTELGLALQSCEVPVLVADPTHHRLRLPRTAGLPVYYGDILAEGATEHVDLIGYSDLLAASDNDAYNTLVASDLGHEFGSGHVWQTRPERAESARHALPAGLGGRMLGTGLTAAEAEDSLRAGGRISVTRLSERFTAGDWHQANPAAVAIGIVSPAGTFHPLAEGEAVRSQPGLRVIALQPAPTSDKS